MVDVSSGAASVESIRAKPHANSNLTTPLSYSRYG